MARCPLGMLRARARAKAVWDAAVVGGGFYGATLARYLMLRRGFRRVILLEREPELMQRASSRNQGRIHAGYHYPRSLLTAARSRVNVARFLHDHPTVLKPKATALYAIARTGSRTSARQFTRFCLEIGAPLQEAPPTLAGLFDPRVVEAVFAVSEPVMDIPALMGSVRSGLEKAGVSVQLGCEVRALRPGRPEGLELSVRMGDKTDEICAHYIFNCTYSALRDLTKSDEATPLRHELAEIAVISAPEAFAEVAVTVMDGPFFSLLPHHLVGTHTLSHVRHTPHASWSDGHGITARERLESGPPPSHFERMIRDAARFVPSLREAKHLDSIFEVKTLLEQNEVDDGRPILLERSPSLPGCYAILGGKIDNVYDALDRLDAEPMPLPGAP